MGSYRPLEPRVFHGSAAARGAGGLPAATWINLGLWAAPGQGYVAACRAMASAVGAAAQLGPKDRVLDVGCGCGDSLALWRSDFKVASVLGVNVTASEVDLARQRCAGLADVEVEHAEALQFARSFRASTARPRFDKILCVDALYHVNTRREFLAALSAKPGPFADTARRPRFAAIDTLGSRDVLAAHEVGQPGAVSTAFWRAPVRVAALALIGMCSGIPLENLLYSSIGLKHLVTLAEGRAAEVVSCEVVTKRVFAPFASHMIREAWRALWKEHDLARALQLAGAAGFMRLMAASGLVQVAVYAIDFH